jgi:tRNA(fMet)-specific endonuclease VapC
MIYILDTDMITIAELRGSDAYRHLHSHVAQLSPNDELATTVITYEEQTRGWMAYIAKMRTLDGQVKAYAQLKRHLLNYFDFEVLDFSPAAAAKFQQLRAAKVRIGTADLKIAATTLSYNATLLSRNLRDFSQVPGLRVEDWSTP